MSAALSSDQLKIFVRHYFETAWNDQQLDEPASIPEQMQDRSSSKLHPSSEDAEYHLFEEPLCIYLGAERLPMSLAQARNTLRKTFPDIHLTIIDLLVEEEKVAVRWRMQGTDLGGYETRLPTGKHISITGISLLRLEEQRITEAWVEVDIAGMQRQLGYVSTPQPPRVTMKRALPALSAKKGEL